MAKDEAGISKTVFVFTEVLSQEVFQRDGCHYFLPINHQVNVGKLLSLPVRPNTEGTFFLDIYQLIEDRVLKHVLDRHNLQRGQQLALHWLGKPASYLDKSNLSPNTFKDPLLSKSEGIDLIVAVRKEKEREGLEWDEASLKEQAARPFKKYQCVQLTSAYRELHVGSVGIVVLVLDSLINGGLFYTVEVVNVADPVGSAVVRERPENLQ
ncbi:MAG: hypothetical protein M1812_008198 [Candelaria pacifica]|nr:MAG: hypothetical protein M1812_008198 [Candelaria pacifica]